MDDVPTAIEPTPDWRIMCVRRRLKMSVNAPMNTPRSLVAIAFFHKPMKFALILLGCMVALTACTSVTVKPVAAGQTIKSVTIRENPKVAVADFLSVLETGFARHGINTKVIKDDTYPKDEYILTYVAFREWDLAPYLTRATLKLERNGELVAFAEYRLRGGGGLAPTKWAGTKSKIDPVIDQLLQNVN